MKKPDTILDEIHVIRKEIYEEIKDMSSSEQTAYFNKIGEDIAKKYGLQRVESA